MKGLNYSMERFPRSIRDHRGGMVDTVPARHPIPPPAPTTREEPLIMMTELPGRLWPWRALAGALSPTGSRLLATVGALLLGLRILRNDHRGQQREQAANVAVWDRGRSQLLSGEIANRGNYVVTLHNQSKQTHPAPSDCPPRLAESS